MKRVYPVAALKNPTTDQLAQDIAATIYGENNQEYKLLIDVFKSYDLKMWGVLAFKDRVHWLVQCHNEKRNIVTGELL